MAYSKLIMIGAVIALSGCVSVLPEPTVPDALYAIEASGTRQSLDANIIVREAEAPQISAGQAIVTEDASGALRLLPSIEWAGASTRLLQLAIVDSFGGGQGTAVLPETGISAPFEVMTRVQYFGLRGDTAVCRVSVQVVESRGRRLIGSRDVSVESPSLDGSTQARGAQMKTVAGQCVSEISERIATLVNSQDRS